MSNPRTQYAELSSNILQAKHRDATDQFCGMLVDGSKPADAMTFVMDVAAPYLNVPAHAMLKNDGEMRGINYDHVILGMWRSPRMGTLLPDQFRQLPLTQAMWYLPQGMDIWSQILCEFPGHYALEQEKCPSIDLKGPKHVFDDYDPLSKGSFRDRIEQLLNSIVVGERVEAYRTFLGLATDFREDPAKKREIENAILYAGVIDIQETMFGGGLQNTGHKALRARAMVELSNHLGWEHSRSLFRITVPDLAAFPRFYDLYMKVSKIVSATFGSSKTDFKNREHGSLTIAECEELIGCINDASVDELISAITSLIEKGRSIISIGDAIIVATARYMGDLEDKRALFKFSHVFDYTNVVNYWIKRYDDEHQVKGIYLAAAFCNDYISLFRTQDHVPLTSQPKEHSRWADSFEVDSVLVELTKTIEQQKAAESTALVDSYLKRTDKRDELISTLVLGSAKFEGDPHLNRNAMSHHEEYIHSSLPMGMKDAIFRSWIRFLSGGIRRSVEFNCYGLYQQHFVS